MFGVVWKMSHFSKLSVNCQFNLCLILCAGPIDIRNRDSRPPLDLFRHHKSNGGVRIDK